MVGCVAVVIIAFFLPGNNNNHNRKFQLQHGSSPLEQSKPEVLAAAKSAPTQAQGKSTNVRYLPS